VIRNLSAVNLLCAAAIGAAGAAFACAGAHAGPVGTAAAADTEPLPAAHVIVVRTKSACFAEAIHVTGFLVARNQAVVPLDLPGYRVTEVLAKAGDHVVSGQALARLKRASGVPNAGAAGPATKTLEAPAAGTITQSAAVVGATAASLQRRPLFQIAVNDTVELEAEVPSIHLPALSPGQRARVFVGDTQEFSGWVRLVPSAVNRSTQLGQARIALDGSPELRPGTFAQATIDANRSCGISVPTSAVTYHTGGTSVQVVRNNVIETRMVRVGFHSDTETEIRSGLKEGDVVVSNAGSSLRNGDRVSPIFNDSLRSELR
jgi:multidrug efflux pump subunit AcrA (membrane-fusion protein)